jgi:hypothetical protein
MTSSRFVFTPDQMEVAMAWLLVWPAVLTVCLLLCFALLCLTWYWMGINLPARGYLYSSYVMVRCSAEGQTRLGSSSLPTPIV